MKSSHSRRLAIAFSAALLLSLFGCRQTPSETATTSTTTAPVAASTTPFKIAFNTWVGYSPLLLAKEKGFLREEGIDVDISILEGVPEKNAAMIRGAIDGVGHTADSAVVSQASGVDGQIVFVFDRSLGADGILTRNNITNITDLRGKKVALEPGFTGHFFFLSLLKDAGMSAKDVHIVPMDTGSAGSTFVAGKVDAAATWEPWIGKVRASAGTLNGKVFTTSKEHPGLIIDVLYMNRDTITKRHADVVKLVRAMGRATDWYATHKAEGDAIMAKFWKLSPEEESSTVAGMEFMPLPQNATFFGTAEKPGQMFNTVSLASQLWRESDVIKQDVEPKSLIAFDVVQEAAAQY